MKIKLKKPTSPQPSPPAAREKIPAPEAMRVAYGLVRPDPNQPRKTFSEASLAELAASIKEQGIIQPLILEHVPAKFKIKEPDLHHDDYQLFKRMDGWQCQDTCDEKNFKSWSDNWAGNYGGLGTEQDYKDGYVIVAGERRWRAAGMVGLTELPAVVHRGLTDQQRFAIQFIENNQRENVSALEEAEAMQGQLASRRKDKPDFSPEDLAMELGISRAGCYERLKLTRLHAPVRAALLAGKISTSVAGEVAKLPTPQSQEKLLKTITDEESYHFPYSVRDVQEIIDDEYCKQLSDAPFDLKALFIWNEQFPIEMQQAPEHNTVYVNPCAKCPLRTGNMLAEFPELKAKPNVCTNPVCFGEKCRAHWLSTAEAAKAKGAVVMTEKDFKKVKGDYIAADEHCYGVFEKVNGTPAGILGKHAPEPALVSTVSGLKKVFKRTDIAEAATKAKVQLRARETEKALTPEQKAKAEKDKADAQALGDRRRAYVETQLPVLAKLLPKLKAAKVIELAALLVEDMDGYWDEAITEDLAGKSKDPQTRLLGRLFADNEKQPVRHYSHEWCDEGVDAWILAGIDLVDGFEKADKAAQKALPLTKAAPEQGKLLNVKPAKKKGKKK